MWLRKMLRTAAIVVPLVSSPIVASAQERGLDRAATARAQATAVGETNDNGRAITQLPRGIARVFANLPLPPGLARRFVPPAAPVPEPQPEPEPEPQPEPEPEPVPVCDTNLVYIGGMPYMVDCHGNQTPIFGG